MKVDSVCSQEFASELGVELHSIDSVVPNYLGEKTLPVRWID